MFGQPMPAAHEHTPVYLLRGDRQLVLGGQIGRGSQGVVHVARMEQVLGSGIFARPVAVKIVEAASCDADLFCKSIRRIALVSHPNVVQVLECFMVGDAPHVVLELIEGMSLSSFISRWELSRRRMPLDLALFLACEVAEGLAGARNTHNMQGGLVNMTHHDLSARQVLLSWNGEVKVGDFGRRAAGEVVSGVRRTGRDMRSRVSHLAPEVARGAHGDARSDVFSLGVLLHEMLYGPRFAPGTSTEDILALVRDGVVERPVLAPLLPGAIHDVVERALELDPRTRQAHAGIIAYDLRREALALGVGDGRMFLRNALFEMSESRSGHDLGA
jgi:eukaryotic-like serine/threonine-protein kinase